MIFMCLPFEMVWRGTVGRVCKDFARILDCARVRRCMREDRWERYSYGMPPTLRFAAKVHALAVAPTGVYVALDNIIMLVSATGAVLRTIRYDLTGYARLYALAVRGDQLFAACVAGAMSTTYIYGWKDDCRFTAMTFNPRYRRVDMWGTDTTLFVVVCGAVYELCDDRPLRSTYERDCPWTPGWRDTTIECGGRDVNVVANTSSSLLVATLKDAFMGYALVPQICLRSVNIDTGRINSIPSKNRSLFVTIEKTTREIPCTPRHVAVYKGVVFTGGRTLCMW
jgi:hypothetical protein